ncbi:MAG: hypothetical protein Q9221_005507 [Calogaya cf. arnoldii]
MALFFTDFYSPPSLVQFDLLLRIPPIEKPDFSVRLNFLPVFPRPVQEPILDSVYIPVICSLATSPTQSLKMVGLKIDSAPFRPSLLRNHYTPRLPVSPLESVAKRVCSSLGFSSGDSPSSSSSSTHSQTDDPPPSPYKWIWQCHECNTTYQIGTTRRCLLDDHELCYGQPVKKRSKKGKKKTRACQSQFDYTGWQAWGAWKRSTLDGHDTDHIERNCIAVCDWPSQCRWNRTQEKAAVQDCTNHASETTSEETETATTPTNEDGAIKRSKSSGSLISKIGTATHKLTLQWTSMLTSIEEEQPVPDMAAIEDFLSSATTPTEPSHSRAFNKLPFIAPLEIVKATNTNPATAAQSSCSKADMKTPVFGLGLGFDFGVHPKREQDLVPSVKTGFKDLVNGTVSIALSTPSRERRCVSKPPTQSVPLQEQPQSKRRVSMG